MQYFAIFPEISNWFFLETLFVFQGFVFGTVKRIQRQLEEDSTAFANSARRNVPKA